ncbi:glycosyltransferase [Pontibacter silvestris]|uniref:Glycosyltransferase n=1 Tax=Pontibacter silvestris TaxID=2305183 RepID=A0ABW4WY87_9BACT|nr:glycosyltransferase [Pontibacter silvestris]MCC9137333.1 glycosyltransferase [Pontibacter silvestris]
MEEKNYLLFYAKGISYNKEAVLAILSLLQVYKQEKISLFTIVIYSDTPELYTFLQKAVSIKIIPFSEKQIEQWSTGSKSFLRTKIAVIQEFLHTHKGNMLFVDTDVVFTKKIDYLFSCIEKGKLVLHVKENKLKTKGCYNNKAYYDSFSNKQFTLKSGRNIKVTGNSYMWNSGVIGIASAQAMLIQDVLNLNDELEKINPLKLVEQLSFSLIFGDNAVSAHRGIIHYWFSKEVVHPYIDEMLNSCPQDIDCLLEYISEKKLFSRTLAHKVYYELKPNNWLRLLVKKMQTNSFTYN